jgi:hypothetical protein
MEMSGIFRHVFRALAFTFMFRETTKLWKMFYKFGIIWYNCILIRRKFMKNHDNRGEFRRPFYGAFASWLPGKSVPPANAQGIEAEIPQVLPQVKPRNWSGKPGPALAPDAPISVGRCPIIISLQHRPKD